MFETEGKFKIQISNSMERAKKLNEGKILLAVVMALSTDSWVGPFLRGGKHFMTPSEPAHRNTEKLQSLKLTCLVRLA
ncbi:hypothetical protein SUGI_1002080 [Cryptomeria japonica]|nr:hypothetical protein SUGI_1002080 [Cryptomeria japonica]